MKHLEKYKIFEAGQLKYSELEQEFRDVLLMKDQKVLHY